MLVYSNAGACHPNAMKLEQSVILALNIGENPTNRRSRLKVNDICIYEITPIRVYSHFRCFSFGRQIESRHVKTSLVTQSYLPSNESIDMLATH